MNLTQKLTRSYIVFKFAICSMALLSLDGTRHGNGASDGAVAKLLRL